MNRVQKIDVEVVPDKANALAEKFMVDELEDPLSWD
jgi:hypothetical protein